MNQRIIALRKNISDRLSACRAVCIFSVAVLLLIMAVCATSATAAASGAMDFEIPISELSKGDKTSSQKKKMRETKTQTKKESSPKHVAGKQKKKKGEINPQSLTPETAAAQHLDQAKVAVGVTKGEMSSMNIMGDIRISHEPFSFVVDGRPTVIQAVIYLEESGLKSVNCTVYAVKKGPPSIVKMTKVDGTRFTYSAALPGLAADMSYLRYTISATDASGRESISQEFKTPVTSSPVVPSWQN